MRGQTESVATDPSRHLATTNYCIAKGLFDPLVGDQKRHRRNFETQSLCSFKIDKRLEFRRLLNRRIGRPCSPYGCRAGDGALLSVNSKRISSWTLTNRAPELPYQSLGSA
jgi:hypothetical protein